ncbi:MAG: cytochrome C oxidase subunit IV family protein [Candidatus Eisenbacteria bacterium]
MGEHAHHRNYVKIWAILLGLLVVSILGPMTGIRVVMLVTAFGIALVKAYIVAKYFMHLDVEKPIVHWMMGVALILMVLLFTGLAPDVMKSKGSGWQKDAGFHPVEAVGHTGEHGTGASGEGAHGDAHPAPAIPGRDGGHGAPAESTGVGHDSTRSSH